MAQFQVDVIRGGGVRDGYIEVRPSGISKGVFLEHALQLLQSINDNVDFIMAIGDDTTDESMFEEINRLESFQSINAFGITVGKKPSAAHSYVDDPAAVLDLLVSLTKSVQRDKRFFSSIDLPSRHVSLDFIRILSDFVLSQRKYNIFCCR